MRASKQKERNTNYFSSFSALPPPFFRLSRAQPPSMGLLTIIRKNKLKEKQIRVLILSVAFRRNFSPSAPLTLPFRRGLDNAGKTTVVKKLLHEDVDQVSPTLGFNIRTIIHLGYSLNVCTSPPHPYRRSGAYPAAK